MLKSFLFIIINSSRTPHQENGMKLFWSICFVNEMSALITHTHISASKPGNCAVLFPFIIELILDEINHWTEAIQGSSFCLHCVPYNVRHSFKNASKMSYTFLQMHSGSIRFKAQNKLQCAVCLGIQYTMEKRAATAVGNIMLRPLASKIFWQLDDRVLLNDTITLK